jgi:hypothetical protein
MPNSAIKAVLLRLGLGRASGLAPRSMIIVFAPSLRVRYWRPLSGLFLRRVSPDRQGGIIAALPSVNNLIAVRPGDPVGNPLLQPRIKINNLTAVLAGSMI